MIVGDAEKNRLRPVKVWANTILTESSPELSQGGLILGLSYLTGNSQDNSRCEIAVSFLLIAWMCLSLATAKNKQL